MIKNMLLGGIFIAVALVAGGGNVVWADELSDEELVGIPPKVVADYVHAIIEADRTTYTTHVVARMQNAGIVMAAEGWKKRNALPLPAQMLMLAGLEVEGQGIGLQYRLASLYPIYEKNGPATDFEEQGLQAVEKDSSKPYTGLLKRGDRTYFKAVYADRAISEACVVCHNGHILSSKRDRKLGDVMGGIIISFPID